MDAKPFVKWVGGKRQLLGDINQHIPNDCDKYIEFFVGGGAVFFSLATKMKSVHLNDSNVELMTTFEVIANNHEELINELHSYKNEEEFFYSLRRKDPGALNQVQRAARFIFLNKTAFNGLYRTNMKGEFNAPFGKYINPNFCDRNTIISDHELLANFGDKLILTCADFRVLGASLLDNFSYSKSTFIYMDPPYIPVDKTSFVSYGKEKFKLSDHGNLAVLTQALMKKGYRILLSNSDTQITRDLYSWATIIEVQASRNVNSDGSGRGKIGELLIKIGY